MSIHRIHSVESVGDGDTVTLIIELGMDVLRRARVRLTIVDTPERSEPGWAEARTFTVDWLGAHPVLMVDMHTTSSGRYAETFGRYLADVYDPTTGDSLSSALLQAGHADVWGR